MHKQFSGCWPTMITPFTDDDRVDFKAITAITEWYIRRNCHGIFAVCQSSEMFYLSQTEKTDIAKAVLDAAGGRVSVIASGHTADDPQEQIDQIGKIAETGVDAVVLVSNRLAGPNEDDRVLNERANTIFSTFPNVKFGMYECPYPYRRLLGTEFLRTCAQEESLLMLKDVSCSREILSERITAVKGTKLALLNANTATLLDSLIDGADGYNGVMANFHIDLYRWLYDHFREEPEQARRVSDLLTIAAVSEMRAYPVSAKFHMQQEGIPCTLSTRSKDTSVFNENAMLEIQSLIRLERQLRTELGVSP